MVLTFPGRILYTFLSCSKNRSKRDWEWISELSFDISLGTSGHTHLLREITIYCLSKLSITLVLISGNWQSFTLQFSMHFYCKIIRFALILYVWSSFSINNHCINSWLSFSSCYQCISMVKSLAAFSHYKYNSPIVSITFVIIPNENFFLSGFPFRTKTHKKIFCKNEYKTQCLIINFFFFSAGNNFFIQKMTKGL